MVRKRQDQAEVHTGVVHHLAELAQISPTRSHRGVGVAEHAARRPRPTWLVEPGRLVVQHVAVDAPDARQVRDQRALTLTTRYQ
jgi:hypothetical protein